MTLMELVNIPFEDRDLNWDNKFFMALTTSKLNVLSAEPQEGPDGFSYLLVSTDDGGTEDAQQIIQWLATKGIGLVVNPQKEYPDYVFTYGMLWSFKETGFFFKPNNDVKTGVVEINNGGNFVSGDPSKEFFPSYSRSILREFFRDQGFLSVKILAFSQDQKHYDLLFSVDSLKNPPQKEHDGIAEAISWFLPPHYSIALVPQSGLPGFFEL